MTPMSRVRERGRRALSKVTRRGGPAAATTDDLARLRRRIKRLEDEVQETRRLHRRLAELTDVVEELLVPVAQRDEKRLQEFLDTHSPAL
jgi:Cys-tRNA synthase (O-phospho-L-seryl-tRNA:Cys-tRNA synthase)